ncbi:hypothetical protein [Microvirga sp. M2]|uniref:hypothetical protein n=1 Tax=Microvirga sp. M2 TaxID=3073270 RepID=UPI0039C121DA
MRTYPAWLIATTLLPAIALSAVPAAAQGRDKPLPVVEKPAPPEKNPPGDIPDDQVFIEYRSPLGFSIKVPEGWARRDAGEGVTFSDKYGTVAVAVAPEAAPPTVASVKQTQVASLESSGRAVKVTHVKAEKLPAGEAVAVAYASNSDPNPVTNKAIRLENERYFFWKDGKLATLTMSAPYGADNADQWQLMAKSFRWQ